MKNKMNYQKITEYNFEEIILKEMIFPDGSFMVLVEVDDEHRVFKKIKSKEELIENYFLNKSSTIKSLPIVITKELYMVKSLKKEKSK